MAIEDVEDVVANVRQFRLDLDAVFLRKSEAQAKVLRTKK